MPERVKLSRVQSLFEELSYPVDRDEAAAEFDDVTLLYADGETNLGDLVADIDENRFESPDDLYTELQNTMPVEAVGEPGQSEGDA